LRPDFSSSLAPCALVEMQSRAWPAFSLAEGSRRAEPYGLSVAAHESATRSGLLPPARPLAYLRWNWRRYSRPSKGSIVAGKWVDDDPNTVLSTYAHLLPQ